METRLIIIGWILAAVLAWRIWEDLWLRSFGEVELLDRIVFIALSLAGYISLAAAVVNWAVLVPKKATWNRVVRTKPKPDA